MHSYEHNFAASLHLFVANFGFSLGINDVIPGPVLSGKKDSMVEKAYAACEQLIIRAKKGLLENKPGCDQEQTLEAEISKVLSDVRGNVGNICMEELSRHNAPLIMASCGSKGAHLFYSQACENFFQRCAQVPSSTCPRWLLVSGNKSSPAIVYQMGSRTARSHISPRNPENLQLRVSCATPSTPDSLPQSSSSTLSRAVKVWSILPSRQPRLVTCSGV